MQSIIKIFLIIIAVLCSLITSAQVNNLGIAADSIDWNEKKYPCKELRLLNGGIIKECYDSKEILTTSITQNNLETIYDYFSTGQVQSISLIRNKQNIGFYTEFYPNGEILASGQFSTSVKEDLIIFKDSVWLQTTDGLGEIFSHWEVFSSPKNGSWNYYYDNGIIQIEGFYDDNKRNGKWRYYNSYGELVLIRTYKMGHFIEDKMITQKEYVMPPK